MFLLADAIMILVIVAVISLGVYYLRREARRDYERDREKEIKNALADKTRCEVERLDLNDVAKRMSERYQSRRGGDRD